MIIVYLLLFVIAFFAYYKKYYTIFLICALGLLTNFFMLNINTNNLNIQGSDFALILFIGLLPLVFLRNRNVFRCNDQLTKVVYCFLFLYILELFFSVILGIETLINSFKVIRTSQIMWAYFIIKSIPIEESKRFLKIALSITLVQGVFYLLQFAGINLLSGRRNQELLFGTAGSSPINIPSLTFLFIFLIWKFNYLHSKRIVIFSYLIFLVLLTFVRGSVLAVIFGLAYLAFVNSGRKYRLPVVLAFLLLLQISTRVIDAKSKYGNYSSATDEISYVLNNIHDFSNIDQSAGTFSFRVALLSERVVWLLDNPMYLVTGVGTMHEDSPRTLTMFNFEIGTRNIGRHYGQTIIESGDITWAPIVLRYGLIGVIIHLLMFIILFINARKRKDALVILAAFMICMFLRSFDGAFFDLPFYVYLLAFCYSLISRSNLEHKPFLM